MIELVTSKSNSPPLITYLYLSLNGLSSGDEIFSVNGRSVAGLTHSEAIGIFKETKVGSIQVTLGRREARQQIVQIDGDVQC